MMDCDVFNEDASELSIIEKDWKKVQHAREKAGFVAGVTAGEETSTQQGFNVGFQYGFLASFLLSQIKGIIKGLMSYHALYEGHPITDDVIMDAEQLLDDICVLETDSVAQDFLLLKINTSNENESFETSSYSQELPDIEQSNQPSHPCSNFTNEKQFNTIVAGSSHPSLDEANQLLSSCPRIADVIQRCKLILRRLRWKDPMIDSLISLPS